MKKSIIFVFVLSLVLVFCLVGCNKNFQFKELGFTKDNVTEIQVTYHGDSKKIDNNSDPVKKENILAELNKLNIAKSTAKVDENVFKDSVVGKIAIKSDGVAGSFVMIFVETNENGNPISLLKCEAVDGYKMKNMPKDIYQLKDVNSTNALLNKIFANYI